MKNLNAARDVKLASMKLLVATADAEGRQLTAKESKSFDALDSEIAAIDVQLGKDSATEAFRAQMRATTQPPMVDIDSRPAAPTAGAWRDSQGRAVPVLTKDQSFRAALRESTTPCPFGFGEYLRAMALGTENREIRMALGENTLAGGGATVPTDLLHQVIDRLRNQAVVTRAGALTVPLPTEITAIARLDTDPTVSWKAENAQFGSGDPTFDRVLFTAKTLGCLVLVSRELLQDSLNIDEVLLNSFAKSMALQLDLAALIGDGNTIDPGGPVGISNTAGIGSVSMGANGGALTDFDPIVDAIQTMRSANAAEPTAVILAPRTEASIAKLKDTLGQPLRKPDMITKLPFLATNQIPTNETQGTSNNATQIITGDFTQLMLGIRSELRIEMLKERYADYLQMGFLCWLRADVQLAHAPSFAEVIGITN